MKNIKIEVGRKYIDWFRKEVVEVKEKLTDTYFMVEVDGMLISTPKMFLRDMCGCPSCQEGLIHQSDCLAHNEPAEKNGKCNCNPSYLKNAIIIQEMEHH